MPSALRGMVDEMRKKPRQFVAPPGQPPAPGSERPGRPRSAVRAMLEESMGRGGVAGGRKRPLPQVDPAQVNAMQPAPPAPPIRTGGVKPSRDNVGQAPPMVPTGTGGIKPSRTPFTGTAPPWFPQPDPAVLRRAQFGQWLNQPGAPEPDLGHTGPNFNPFTNRWV